MKDVSIIGAGKLGTCLGMALSQKGYRIKALSCRKISAAQESSQIIKQGIPLTDNVQTAKLGKIIIISVPDDYIEGVVKELSSASLSLKNKFIFHCSGLLSAEVLDPLKNKGAFTLSVHPVQTFPQKRTGSNMFKSIYFSLEGSGEEGLNIGRKLVQDLGGQAILIKASDKPLYHAACSISSNLLVALLHMSSSLLQITGIREEKALSILFPLIQQTLSNVKKLNIPSALTGPVIRGDQESIRKHREVLKSFPTYYNAYRSLALLALEIAQGENKLSPQKIDSIKSLLEDK